MTPTVFGWQPQPVCRNCPPLTSLQRQSDATVEFHQKNKKLYNKDITSKGHPKHVKNRFNHLQWELLWDNLRPLLSGWLHPCPFTWPGTMPTGDCILPNSQLMAVQIPTAWLPSHEHPKWSKWKESILSGCKEIWMIYLIYPGLSNHAFCMLGLSETGRESVQSLQSSLAHARGRWQREYNPQHWRCNYHNELFAEGFLGVYDRIWS